MMIDYIALVAIGVCLLAWYLVERLVGGNNQTLYRIINPLFFIFIPISFTMWVYEGLVTGAWLGKVNNSSIYFFMLVFLFIAYILGRRSDKKIRRYSWYDQGIPKRRSLSGNSLLVVAIPVFGALYIYFFITQYFFR